MGNARQNKKKNLEKNIFIRWAMPDKIKKKNKAKPGLSDGQHEAKTGKRDLLYFLTL